MKIEVVEIIESAAFIPCGTTALSKPGIIARFDDERRAVLREIKSSDACIVNPSPRTLAWALGPEGRRGRRSKRWSL
jgi:hypothetical protein